MRFLKRDNRLVLMDRGWLLLLLLVGLILSGCGTAKTEVVFYKGEQWQCVETITVPKDLVEMQGGEAALESEVQSIWKERAPDIKVSWEKEYEGNNVIYHFTLKGEGWDKLNAVVFNEAASITENDGRVQLSYSPYEAWMGDLQYSTLTLTGSEIVSSNADSTTNGSATWHSPSGTVEAVLVTKQGVNWLVVMPFILAILVVSWSMIKSLRRLKQLGSPRMSEESISPPVLMGPVLFVIVIVLALYPRIRKASRSPNSLPTILPTIPPNQVASPQLLATSTSTPSLSPTQPASSATPVSTSTEPTTPTPEPTETPDRFQVGLVTDVGGINDGSFNIAAWSGVRSAANEFGLKASYLESQSQDDYASNIKQFLGQGADMIITVGFLLKDVTLSYAEQNPETDFVIVDVSYENPPNNLLGLSFAVDEAAFLAGYLAAGMSETGKVGTFGGIEIPPVSIFIVGYENGVRYYNRMHGTNVEVLGTNTYVGNFESTEDGKATGMELINAGADVIMPVAGPVGLGTAAAVKENSGTMLIGVEDDWCMSAQEYCDVLLTSVMKDVHTAVFTAIERSVKGDFRGSSYVGMLGNGGVRLAPFHEFESSVPDQLPAELEQVKEEVTSGAIDTGWR